MTSPWIAVTAAGLGAGGAVAAQVVAGILTARRESARLTWEQERQERDWKFRESERFLSNKQELYSRYIALLYEPIMDTVSLTREEYAVSPDWHSKVPGYSGGLMQEIDSLRWNIRLLGSPVVAERVEFSNATFLVAVSEAGRPDRSSLEKRHALADQALRAWQDVSNVMRDDLRGDEAALKRRGREVARPTEGHDPDGAT
jgi:hypothetical protein